MDLIKLEMWVTPKQDWVLSRPFPGILIVFHSPNTIPEFVSSNIIEIGWNTLNEVKFSKINIEMLGSDYDTNCYEYDLDYKYGNFNMRSDCITHCFYDYIMKKCDYGDNIPGSSFLLREDTLKYKKGCIEFEENYNPRMCYVNKFDPAHEDCKDLCRPDCKSNYYIYENKRKEWESRDMPEKDHFYLSLSHNSYPDIVIKYLPKTTFISFVCSFGGLLGMWVGLSFLTMLDEGLKVTVSFIKKPIYYFCPNFNFNYIMNQNNQFHTENIPSVSSLPFTKSQRKL